MKESSIESVIPTAYQQRVLEQKEKMKRYAEYAEKLKEKNYITEYIPYEDPRGFMLRDLSVIPEDERMIITHFLDLVEGPMLKDDIEEQFSSNGQAIKGTRKHIREFMHSLGEEAYRFYENGKMQASNISNALNLVSFLQMSMAFSEKTTKEYEDICNEFTNADDHAFKIDAYYHLSKDEKYAFVEKYTKLIEDVMEEALDYFKVPKNVEGQ